MTLKKVTYCNIIYMTYIIFLLLSYYLYYLYYYGIAYSSVTINVLCIGEIFFWDL